MGVPFVPPGVEVGVVITSGGGGMDDGQDAAG